MSHRTGMKVLLQEYMLLLALALAFVLGASWCAGCCEVADPPPDAAEPQRGCHVVCAWEDDDPLTLPAGRCPGATPEACILECESGFADGNFCAAP